MVSSRWIQPTSSRNYFHVIFCLDFFVAKLSAKCKVHTVFFLALDDLDWGCWDFESFDVVVAEDVLALSRPRSGKSCSTFNGTCRSLALFNLLKVDHSGGWGSSRVVKVGIMLSPVSSNLIGTILDSALTSLQPAALVLVVGLVDFCCPLKRLMKSKQIGTYWCCKSSTKTNLYNTLVFRTLSVFYTEIFTRKGFFVNKKFENGWVTT